MNKPKRERLSTGAEINRERAVLDRSFEELLDSSPVKVDGGRIFTRQTVRLDHEQQSTTGVQETIKRSRIFRFELSRRYDIFHYGLVDGDKDNAPVEYYVYDAHKGVVTRGQSSVKVSANPQDRTRAAALVGQSLSSEESMSSADYPAVISHLRSIIERSAELPERENEEN